MRGMFASGVCCMCGVFVCVVCAVRWYVVLYVDVLYVRYNCMCFYVRYVLYARCIGMCCMRGVSTCAFVCGILVCVGRVVLYVWYIGMCCMRGTVCAGLCKMKKWLN